MMMCVDHEDLIADTTDFDTTNRSNTTQVSTRD